MQNNQKRQANKKRKVRTLRVALFCVAFSLTILVGLGILYVYHSNRTMYAGNVIPVQATVGKEVETPVEWKTLEEELVMEVEERVRLVMVGDMLMHLRVTQSGRMEDGTYNYDHIFEHVREDIQAADIALVNQEIILGGPDLGYSGYPMFNTAYELGDAIDDAGFDVVLHATNHTMDKGRAGLMNCLNYWSENHPDIKILGANKTQEEYEEVYIYEQDGMKIAILNYTYGLNGMPMPSDMPFAVDMMDEDKMSADLAKAEAEADFTVVCIHWGNEYQTYASENQKMWSNYFLERGVDLIIGTHPHVIQPVEWYEDEEGNRMLVYYSIGNFINSTADSGRGIGARVVGAMAEVEIIRDENGEVVIGDYGVTPLVTQIEAGPGNITTYKLEDYSQELADSNQMSYKDPGFSYEFCKELCREVFGDLYTEE
ncbi:MAG: CapA family protein [Lachnospiraceae bacterium]|nr:CapA family protein [Lachnospiraceae bacterium]